MTIKTEATGVPESTEPPATTSATAQHDASGKKAFVEPEITAGVDILEATTFFQGLTSGKTNN